MTDVTRHLTWDNFNAIIVGTVPGIHRVIGSPPIDLFVDPSGARIGLRVPYQSRIAVPPSPLSEVEIKRIRVGEEDSLEITTSSRLLYPQFYSLMTAIADRIQNDRTDPLTAFRDTLNSWHILLRSTSMLTDDQQLGLLGELWMLKRLLARNGPHVIGSWTGPLSEEHDFRIGILDFEVKSTRSLKREHIISNLQQLQCSPGRRLFLLSLQFGLAPSILSLPKAVQEIRTALLNNDRESALFESLLANGAGYRDEYASYYSMTYFLRSQAILVPVDERFPKITPVTLANIAEGHRISDVTYRLNIEGMGFTEDSAQFSSIIPSSGGYDV